MSDLTERPSVQGAFEEDSGTDVHLSSGTPTDDGSSGSLEVCEHCGAVKGLSLSYEVLAQSKATNDLIQEQIRAIEGLRGNLEGWSKLVEPMSELSASIREMNAAITSRAVEDGVLSRSIRELEASMLETRDWVAGKASEMQTGFSEVSTTLARSVGVVDTLVASCVDLRTYVVSAYADWVRKAAEVAESEAVLQFALSDLNKTLDKMTFIEELVAGVLKESELLRTNTRILNAMHEELNRNVSAASSAVTFGAISSTLGGCARIVEALTPSKGGRFG